jgi:ABC-type Fe3+/spermidine/putrescine transport system ATPase subunit
MNQFPPLQASHLNHRYGSVQVLTPLDITLKSGEIAILEGPNGSGKSTLLLCLSGLLRPTSGEVWVDGHNLAIEEPAAKRCLAFVPDVSRVYLELTVGAPALYRPCQSACVDFRNEPKRCWDFGFMGGAQPVSAPFSRDATEAGLALTSSAPSMYCCWRPLLAVGFCAAPWLAYERILTTGLEARRRALCFQPRPC